MAAIKFNWRYAKFEVFYKKKYSYNPDLQMELGQFSWLNAYGQVWKGPWTLTQSGYDKQPFLGMPGIQPATKPFPDLYSTTVNTNNADYARQYSYIYGCRNNRRLFWVPFHRFYFYVPQNLAVTYERIDPPVGYDDAFVLLLDNEVWGGEVTVNAQTQYTQPDNPPYTGTPGQ